MKEKASRWLDQLPLLTGTLLGCLWLGLFPLWNGGTYSHITLDKWLGMNWLAGIGGGLTVLTLLLLAARRQLRQRLSLGLPHLLLALYLLWMALAARFGAWHTQTNSKGQLVTLFGAIRYEGLWTLLTYGGIFLCLSLFPIHRRTVLAVTATALLAAAALAAVQYFNTNPLGLFPKNHSILINYEFQSTLGNIDILNGYLALAVPLLLGGWMLERRGGYFLAAAGVGILWALCIDVQSGLLVLLSTAGVLGVIALHSAPHRGKALIALSVFCLALSLRWLIRLPWLDGVDVLSLQWRGRVVLPLLPGALLLLGGLIAQRHPGKNLPWKPLLLLLVILSILLLVLFIRLEIPESMGGLWEIHEVLRGHLQDSFGNYRIGVWRHTLHMVREHPWLGIGPDTYYYAMQEHLRLEGASLPEVFDNPHNMALSVLVSGGIPALLSWVALMVVLLAQGLRRGGFALVCSLALAAYLLQGMFVFSICLMTPMFWAVAGLCTTAAKKQKGGPASCP